MEYNLTCPVTKEDLTPLRAGDRVFLSGTVYTARDAAHKRMMELLDSGKELPFPLPGSAIYYVGPTPEKPGCVIVRRNGAVYLAAIGGAGALMAGCIKKAEIVCWADLGCEAVRRLEVENMPLTVIIDSVGGDLYESGPAAYLKSLK